MPDALCASRCCVMCQMFRAYSAPQSEEADGDRVSPATQALRAQQLFRSLAALAKDPLSDAANVLAAAPRSKADRAMASEGLEEARERSGAAGAAGADAEQEPLTDAASGGFTESLGIAGGASASASASAADSVRALRRSEARAGGSCLCHFMFGCIC